MSISKDFIVKNGIVVNQDILLGGTLKDLSGTAIELGSTSSDTYTIKDQLLLQQSETPIGTVTAKSTIPATTEPIDYVGTQTGNPATEEIYSVLNLNYAYFYSNYADIYSADPSTNTKIREFFAVGNTVRITKDGNWWDLQITGTNSGSSTGYYAPTYNVIASSNPNYSFPSNYDAYYSWNQNISFSTNLPVPQKYVLTLNAPANALEASDKLLIDGALTGTPYLLNVTNRGTWNDYGITAGSPDQVIFGSNLYNTDREPLIALLQPGTTITIYDNTWGVNGTYLVSSVGADTIWNTTYGFSVQFQYVSGTDYKNTYTNLASIFASYFLSANGTVIPNYTTEYRSSNFSTLNGTSYVSFDNYDFVNIGDVISYIPGTTSVVFKDDTGNNVKAITYNNLTGEMTYDGVEQPIIINDNNTIYSSNIGANSSMSAAYSVAIGDGAVFSGSNVVAIGRNSNASESTVAIGTGANASSIYATAIGYNSGASTFGTAMGYSSYSGSGVAIGTNASSNDGIAIRGQAYGTSAINIGPYTSASQPGQFKYSTTNSNSYINETSSVFWSDGNLTGSGAKYLYARNGANNTSQTSQTTSNSYSVDIGDKFSKNQRMMLIGTATIMIKPTGDTNNDDAKVIEVKMVIRSTATNTFTLEILSTNNIFAGTGTLHPNWIPTFELFQNRYLHFKMDKGSDSTNLGVLCKVDFQVLHTA